MRKLNKPLLETSPSKSVLTEAALRGVRGGVLERDDQLRDAVIERDDQLRHA